MNRECRVDGCSNATRCKGLCKKHYGRWLKHGDPLKVAVRTSQFGEIRIPLEERFWAKVQKGATCWLWTGATSAGYGRIFVGRDERGIKKRVEAHRVAYELLVGPIPDGLVIDHLCQNRACVNPAHMEPVTSRENTLRGRAARRRATCRKGHALTPENTYVYPSTGGRSCRQCRAANRKTK